MNMLQLERNMKLFLYTRLTNTHTHKLYATHLHKLINTSQIRENFKDKDITASQLKAKTCRQI